MNKSRLIKPFSFFCSQHAVLFVAVALALYQDLKAPPLAH